MAQIRPVTSEALEAQIRALLPSQNGFGEDLQASNVITPIIDLTQAAQGTLTPSELRNAANFGGNTAFTVSGTSTTLISTPGFWRIIGTANHAALSTGAVDSEFTLSDGLSTKKFWRLRTSALLDEYLAVPFDLVVFLRSGDTLGATTTQATTYLNGSYRQIADVNGNFVYPTGFTPQ